MFLELCLNKGQVYLFFKVQYVVFIYFYFIWVNEYFLVWVLGIYELEGEGYRWVFGVFGLQ